MYELTIPLFFFFKLVTILVLNNNVVIDISEINLFIVLKLSAVKHLVFLFFFLFFFFFFPFLLFVFVGITWIVKLNGLILVNKPLNGLHACQEDAWYSRSFMHEEMLELALNVFHELSKKSNIYIYIYIRKWDCVWLWVEESERKGK